MKNYKKILVLAVAALLLVAVSVAGTMAYLTAKTEVVTNEFKTTKIEIELKEHELKADGTLDTTKEVNGTTTDNKYKLLPGATWPKDPFVRVKAGSEKCYVFVEVLKNGSYEGCVESNMDSGWALVSEVTPVHPGAEVYVWSDTTKKPAVPLVVDATSADQKIGILFENEIQISKLLSQEQMQSQDFEEPSISFYGYAVQSEHQENTNATSLWNLINPPKNPS